MPLFPNEHHSQGIFSGTWLLLSTIKKVIYKKCICPHATFLYLCIVLYKIFKVLTYLSLRLKEEKLLKDNEFSTFPTNPHRLEQYCKRHTVHIDYFNRGQLVLFCGGSQESKFYNAYSVHEYFMITAWLCGRYHICIYCT